MTTKESKEYLQQVFYLDKKINRMVREKEALQSILYSVGSVSSEERVQGGSIGNRTENLIAKIDEKERKINSEIDRLVGLKSEVTEKICRIENEIYSDVLLKRYINLEDWGKIAEEMGYTTRHILRVHGEALLVFGRMSLECH